ncbi:MAG TPA: large conductance mechanosensitive channel protein MscL [Pseudogracilibacillus sp.]|nr:large conductance mechanosensitive channel protein MscL [Pseudogracilibacillus sp.]
MLKDFKEFAFQGNLIDLAVAVIFGTAFGAIVTSLVDDIIMPLIGVLMGGTDFSGLAIEVGNATVMYGAFIQTVVNFFIIAGSIFIALRFILRRKKEEVDEETMEVNAQEQLLIEIRDLLKSQSK